MSQKNLSDGGQKGFTVGRGLLAAAETLNFSINEQRSGPQSRTLGSMVSGLGVGGGGESMDRSSQMSRHVGGGGGNHLGSTMKLFASLGLSPADLDALAQIPEEDISVETLPQILMQLKNRKGEAGDRRMAGNPRDLPSLSSESSYQGGRDDWGDMRGERLGGSSMGQASARAPPQADYAYGSMQDASPARGYNLDYGSNNGGTGNRDRQYSDLSRRDSYGGVGMGPPQSDNVFMQRRMGSPSQGKVQDFLGAMPPMFPHVCSLCDFDVHSTMEWNQHTNGLRHAENRRVLLQMYPDWDPGMAQNRGGGASRMETPNLSAGLLGPAPMSQGQTAGGMSSNWGGGPSSNFSNKNQAQSAMLPKMKSRVVVAKYGRKPNNNKDLFTFTEPFGTLREYLVLKTKAFLEMDTHQEAVDMVNYYQQNPAKMFGNVRVIFYLSKELLVIEKEGRPRERPNREVKGQGSQVVFFSNLPREQDKKMELLTVAGRFGLVEKHLFLTDEAFVQLGTPEDAEMMVKYYNQNPLTIRGRSIRLNICTKYKTLNVNRRGSYGASMGDNRGRRSSESTPASKNYPNQAGAKSASSKSTATKEKKKPEEKRMAEEESEEEEEEVAGVMEGDNEAEEGKEECEVEQEPDVEEPQPGTSAPGEVEEEGNEEGAEKLPADSCHAAEALQEPECIPTGDDTKVKDADGAEDEDDHPAETAEPSGPTERLMEEPETREETAADPAESTEMTEGELPEDLEGTLDQDFMENMDDFVTLDELAEDKDDLHTKDSDSFDNTRKGGMRVVNILGFRRGYNFLEELLALAKPFGKVVKHLVLDLKSEAYLQFATEDEAKAMSRFYNSNVTASVCGRPVKICHSQTYPTIQCGGSKVVYIGQLPNSNYTDESVLKLAEPFGQVKKYFVNRIRRECFIEMENAEDAEKIAEAYKVNPPKLQGKRQTVYVSRKYKQLKYGHRRIQLEERKASKRDASSSSSSQDKSSKHPEETPAKRSKEETTPVEEEEAVEREQEEESAVVSSGEQEAAAEPMETQSEDPEPGESDQPGEQDPAVDVKREEVEDVSADQNQNRPAEEPTPAETKPAAASLPLTPYEQNNPVGVEYVRTGFYCRVCFLFYSNEETAKKVHCSSQAHYDKVKKHLEKEQAKAQNKKEKKNLE